MSAEPTTTTTAPAATDSGGDALDKGVAFVSGKTGHKLDRKMTEKISDGIRTFFKKITGKDVPIKDQN